jgi:hypothetical protein
MNEKWLTQLSVEELRQKAVEFKKPYEPFAVNGKIVYQNRDEDFVYDEVFKHHPIIDVEASNYGRIRHNGVVLEQHPDTTKPEPTGYLWVEIPGVSKYLVYRLVAETWCEHPLPVYTTVHHISNNGTDNRPDNLLWVTAEQHAEIHPFLKDLKRGSGV